MHMHAIEDERGDLVDLVNLCSDACHRDWCVVNGVAYDGWDGCHELEFTSFCAHCGVVIPGLDDACEHQRGNVVVNRLSSANGEKCEHGNWIQLPELLRTHV